MAEDSRDNVIRIVGGMDETPSSLHKINLLLELNDRFDNKIEFKKGMLACWKYGLRNRKYPEYGDPVIIRDVVDPPITDMERLNSGSPYFKELLDIVIGIIDENGDLLEFYVDSRRFEIVYPSGIDESWIVEL